MEPNQQNKKSCGIVAAIDAGRSCEQILAADRSLSYHDIFRAVTEMPTSHWSRGAAGISGSCCVRRGSGRTPAKQRSD